jgi:hypothetical protein
MGLCRSSSISKDFLKDKPKEDFDKAPTMPEDMKELFKQRQRELAAERAEQATEAKEEGEGGDAKPAATDTEPKLEQTTMPPPPKPETTEKPPKTEPVAPRTETPPPPVTRPREWNRRRRRQERGDGEP